MLHSRRNTIPDSLLDQPLKFTTTLTRYSTPTHTCSFRGKGETEETHTLPTKFM